MNTVVLEVRSLAETLADASRAMKAGRSGREARIGFATPELLWQVLTAKRWDLLKAMCGWGALCQFVMQLVASAGTLKLFTATSRRC